MATSPRTAVRRLALARLISLTGGAAAYTALMFAIYRRTGSAAWLAATLFVTFGAVGFVSPVASALGDRFSRRRVMIVSDLGGAAAFVGLAFARAPALMLAIAFCSALAEAPFWSASSAAVPNLLGSDQNLGWANGLLQMGANGGIFIGPVVGGLLVASIGPAAVFAINAASFVVSAGLIAGIDARFDAQRPPSDEHRGIRAGLRYVWRDRVLRTIALAWMTSVLGGGLAMVADLPLAHAFGKGSLGYGLMIAGWGGGSVLGSLAGRFLHAGNEGRALILGAGLAGLSTTSVGLTPWFAPVVPAILVAGFGDAMMVVAYQGIMQRRTPDAVRSRVDGAMDAAIRISLALSFAVAGVAVASFGPKTAYIVAGGSAAAAAGLLLPLRRATLGAGRTVAAGGESVPAIGEAAAVTP